MLYVLRVVIHEHLWERQLSDLIDFCRYAKIDEVYLKEQCHQILMSPFPLEKHAVMARIYQGIGEALRKEGIRFSINIASIIGHCDAPLDVSMTLPFTKFVGESLRPNRSTYCILDPEWLHYAEEMLKFYAATDPDVIMIDDDFRSLNHSGYLGCFCPLHVAETAKASGIALDAATLKAHVLGERPLDLKVKAAWRRINFAGQLRAAERIEQAIHAVNPGVRIGLMNSGEPNHSVQGRDMQRLLETFAGGLRPISRPAGGTYADGLHEDIVHFHNGTALSTAQLNDVEIVSEVENWPHTRYTKSLSVTKLQMKLHALAGVDKISMNIFDFMGTPYRQEERIMAMIRDAKAELRTVKDMRGSKTLRGLGMLWHRDAAQTQPNPSQSAERISPDRTADRLFPLLGIPLAFTKQEVNFLQGSVAANLTDKEVENLLKGGLILDSTAFEHLQDRGFGRHLGACSSRYLNTVSAERLTDGTFSGPFTGNMLPTDWMRLAFQKFGWPLLDASPETLVLSEIIDLDYRKIGDGICLYENDLGGRLAILPQKISAWTFAYRSRAFLLRRIFRYLSRDAFDFYLEDGVNIAPFYYADKEEGLLALVNTGLDRESVCIHSSYPLRVDKKELIDGRMELKPLELRFVILDRSASERCAEEN